MGQQKDAYGVSKCICNIFSLKKKIWKNDKYQYFTKLSIKIPAFIKLSFKPFGFLKFPIIKEQKKSGKFESPD